MSPLAFPYRSRGILAAIGSFFCFSASDVLIKYLLVGRSLFQLLPITSYLALLIIISYAFFGPGASFSFKRRWVRLATHYPARQIVRGLLGATSGFCAYQAYRELPLADVYLICFLAPIVLTLAAQLMFRERTSVSIWLAIVAGFSGTYILLQPTDIPLTIYTFYAFLSMATYCCNVLLARTMPKDDVLVFPFYTQLMVLLTTFIPGVLLWQHFSLQEWLLLAAAGCFIAGASLLFFRAYRLAPTALVAPFEYTQLIWGVLAGWLVFNTLPTISSAVGAALIIGAGVFLMLSQRRVRPKKLPIATAN